LAAAAKDNVFLLAVDETACSKKTAKRASVLITSPFTRFLVFAK